MIMGETRQPGKLPTLVDLGTALKMLCVKDRRTVIHLIETGKVKGGKIGSRWKVNRDSLRDYCTKMGIM